jgi:hypothetical protein
MKKIIITVLASLALTTSSFAQINSSNNLWSTNSSINFSSNNVVYQKGYTRSNGTYVQGHYKTISNSTNWDNFSTVGNTNSYTGQRGSVARDYSSSALNYGSGRTIYTGSRGGQYYINSNGNKTYVPKRSTTAYGW